MTRKMPKIILVWCDTETTDFDGPAMPRVKVNNGYLQRQQCGDLLQVAFVITDINLNKLSTVEVSIRPTAIENGDPVALEMARKSGVMDAALAGVSYEQASVILLHELRHIQVQFPGCQLVFANCNAKFDLNWLAAQLPEVHKEFYYRALDVSAVEMAMRTLDPTFSSLVRKEHGHSALNDTLEAIEHFRATQAVLRLGFDNWDREKLNIVGLQPVYHEMQSSQFEVHHLKQLNGEFGEGKVDEIKLSPTAVILRQLFVVATVAVTVILTAIYVVS